MAEYKVYQMILWHYAVVIFVESGSSGSGKMFSFKDTPTEDGKYIEDTENPSGRDDFAGSKLMGSVEASRVQEIWDVCMRLEEENNAKDKEKEEKIPASDRANEAAVILVDKKIVVAKPWWKLPGEE